MPKLSEIAPPEEWTPVASSRTGGVTVEVAAPKKTRLSDLTGGGGGGSGGASPSETPYDKALDDQRKARRDDEVGGTLAHGITLGFSDDADAALSAGATGVANLARDIAGKPKPYGAADAARASREAGREQRAAFSKWSPALAGGLEVGGSLLNPFADMGAANGLEALGVQSPMLKSVLGGGAGGAVAGVGNSDGSPLHRALMAIPGAGFGAATAGAIHSLTNPGKLVKGAAAGVKEILDRARDAMGAEPGKITPAQAAEGKKIGERYVKDIVGEHLVGLEGNAAERSGKPVTAGEALGRKGRGALKTINRMAGKTNDVLDPTLAARNRETAERVLHDLQTVTKINPALVRGEMETVASGLRAKAKPLYDAWHAHEEIDSEALDRIKNTHSGKKALTYAAQIASDEHEDAFKLGLVPEPPEPTIPRGHVVFEHGGRRFVVKKGKEAADMAHALGGAHPVEDGDAHWEAYDEAKAAAESEEKPKVITARGWDYMKRGFDKVLAEHRDPVTHKLDLHDPAVHALKGLRKELGEALTDPTTPWGHDAKAAFDAGGDPIRMEEHFGDGKKLISNTVTEADFKKRLARMVPADKEALKGGILSAMYDAARGNKLRLKELLTPATEGKIRMLWGSKAATDIMERLRMESDLFEHGYRMHTKGGSDTAENLNDLDEHAGRLKNAEKGLRAAASASKGNWWMAAAHAVSSPIMAAYHGSQMPVNEATRNRIGELLMMKPSELAKHLRAEGAKPEEVPKIVLWMEKVGRAGAKVAPRAGAAAAGAAVRSNQDDGLED